MKDWQKKHLASSHEEIVKSKIINDNIDYYARYFYDAMIELYAIERSLGKNHFSVVPVNQLFNIMEGDDIFTNDLYKPTFMSSKKIKIISDSPIASLVNVDLHEKLEYSLSPYFLSRKNQDIKLYYSKIDDRIRQIHIESKNNIPVRIGIFVTAIILLSIYIYTNYIH